MTAKENSGVQFPSGSTLKTLQNACDALGLDPTNAKLMRLGENAVYGLERSSVVVRIARSMHSLHDVEKEMRVARWLGQINFPAARLASIQSDRVSPVVIDEHPISLWERIDEGPRRASAADLGGLLRQLHEAEPPEWLKLPTFDPFSKVQLGLDSAPASVGDEEKKFLASTFERLQIAFSELSFPFAQGVIHGDAHPGNLMCTPSGEVRPIDFECVALGPREWDLSLSAAYG